MVANATKLIVMLAAAGLACGLVVVSPPRTATASSGFAFNWNGKPSAPQRWVPGSINDWDLLVHDNVVSTGRPFTSGTGQHGADCSPYPATHPVSDENEAVFICNNHVMTMLNAFGYGETVMTPAQLADWSNGQVSIDWNVTTLRTTNRDWIEINVTPFHENLVAPADTSQDMEGEPLDTINCAASDGPPTKWACQVVVHGTTVFSSDFNSPAVEEVLKANGQNPSAVIRIRYQLDVSAGHVRLSLPDFHTVLVDANVSLPFTSGVVQLSEQDYDTGKDCSPGYPQAYISCVNNTWHWSDFSISNAVPFTMLRLAPAENGALGGGGSSTPSFNLPRPAPAGSFLRFLGSGDFIYWSADGGRTWTRAVEQQAQKLGQSQDKNYFIPISPGTTSVMFKGQDWTGGPWAIQDPSIWSSNQTAPGPLAASNQPAPGPIVAQTAPAAGGATSGDGEHGLRKVTGQSGSTGARQPNHVRGSALGSVVGVGTRSPWLALAGGTLVVALMVVALIGWRLRRHRAASHEKS